MYILRALLIVTFVSNMLFGSAYAAQETPVVDSLRNIVETSTDSEALVKAYSKLCWIQRSLDPEQAIIYGNKALQLVKKYPNLDSYKPRILNYLGVVNRNKGDYNYAMNYYLEALDCATKQADNIQIAYSNNNLGGVFTLKGDYLSAITYLKKALDYFSKENDLTGMSYVCVNLGNLYRHMGEYSDALDYFDQALDYKKAVNDTIGLAISMNLKAIVLYKMERFSDAKEIYQKLQVIYIHNRDQKGLGFIKYYLGLIAMEDNNMSLAIKYFNKAESINHSIVNIKGVADDQISKALAYAKIGDFKSALMWIEKGSKIANEIGDLETLRDAYKNYSEIYYLHKEYKKAYDFQVKYQETFMKYNDQLTKEKIAALRVNNELDKKKAKTNNLESRNALLEENASLDMEKIRYQKYALILLLVVIILIAIPFFIMVRKNNRKHDYNEELQQKNMELVDANKTREKFLSIIGHDLKNPFNSVLGLASLLVEEWDVLPDSEKKAIIYEIHNSGNSIYELMDNLLLWAKNQSKAIQLHPERFDINEYVIEVYEIFRSQANFKEIKIELNIGSQNNVYADPNMISTVIRNLLSNALKFTRRNGLIKIDVKNNNSEIEFAISDNGKGIPPEDLKRIIDEQDAYSTKGTVNETGTGLGLLVVQDFVKKNNGLFWVESLVNHGSTFRFTLPKEKGI
jgi:signal transduction histidine kinase/uncharacterized protein HemY